MKKLLFTILTIFSLNFVQSAQDLAQQETGIEVPMCLICRSDMLSISAITETPCIHTFHTECIDSWTAIRNICPICSREIRDNYPNIKIDSCIAIDNHEVIRVSVRMTNMYMEIPSEWFTITIKAKCTKGFANRLLRKLLFQEVEGVEEEIEDEEELKQNLFYNYVMMNDDILKNKLIDSMRQRINQSFDDIENTATRLAKIRTIKQYIFILSECV